MLPVKLIVRQLVEGLSAHFNVDMSERTEAALKRMFTSPLSTKPWLSRMQPYWTLLHPWMFSRQLCISACLPRIASYRNSSCQLLKTASVLRLPKRYTPAVPSFKQR